MYLTGETRAGAVPIFFRNCSEEFRIRPRLYINKFQFLEWPLKGPARLKILTCKNCCIFKEKVVLSCDWSQKENVFAKSIQTKKRADQLFSPCGNLSCNQFAEFAFLLLIHATIRLLHWNIQCSISTGFYGSPKYMIIIKVKFVRYICDNLIISYSIYRNVRHWEKKK